MTTNQGKRGRPSKGDRHAFQTRVPRAVALEVFEEASARGMTLGDYIATVVCLHHGSTAMEMPERIEPLTEQLPMTG